VAKRDKLVSALFVYWVRSWYLQGASLHEEFFEFR